MGTGDGGNLRQDQYEWQPRRPNWQPYPSAEGTATELLREERAAPQASMLGRQDVTKHSFEKNHSHHPFVFVVEEMAVEDGHAPDYWVGEVHDDIDGAAIRNVDSVQLHWIGNRLIVFGL
jgi:hypothetical protein